MATRPKILLLDDEQDLVESYATLLENIPSHPEVFTCMAGPRALALLKSESFDLFITDLRLPGIDGLQMLSVVRRKYPRMRTVVLTGLSDEQFRMRAYAMGADLFWQKPDTRDGMQAFQDCVESLLQHTPMSGFRGVQNKNLVDIIQLECLSQNSSVLHIVREGQVADIWMANGNVIDAQFSGLSGESAFREIMTWKSGNFELLPPDTEHPRVIESSYQGLLLDSAQAMDEGRGTQFSMEPLAIEPSPLSLLAETDGVEFLLSLDSARKMESWGLENAESVAQWVAGLDKSFRELGERLEVGDAQQLQGIGPKYRIAVVGREQSLLCVGLNPSVNIDQAAATVKQIASRWLC